MLKYSGRVTVRAKVVVTVVVPIGPPVTLIWNVPVGVEEAVETVSTLDPEGVIEGGLNEQDAAVGRVDVTHDRFTGWAEPPVRVKVIVVVPELPAVTLMLPEFES